ncbi:MAG TPA: type I restriction endonuclease subunit R [Candidatus Coprovicinus avistercoris]|uniref:type I site-specific deoxyribonuclease n=1 Tax=Candidatus Coprovicinus avistercoris TaxID=2840754 RepID=A0A9D1HZP9_9ACTN|nr:type I restriction endonuclease subunit R [Candidatus Coprovicinus avistercoris]
MSNAKYFTELTRVQIPAILHLTRIGYQYFGRITEDMAGTVYDPDTNILLEVFKLQFDALNPDRAGDAMEMLSLIKQELDNDDLGRSFYNRLISQSPVKLIDFDRPWMNVFHCTGEFTCKNGLDEFRPDVTLFVNGLPLAFLEVKKPNNRGGMIAESKRMNLQRFPNRRFRRFINITQLMLFSNNMEYDACGGITPIQGVFYCTAARGNTKFSTFREENPGNAKVAPFNAHYSYEPIDSEIERWILDEFNCQVIRNTPEYQTNMDVNTPTNRVLTSMCSPERFLFLLRYGFAYVRMEREVDGKIESTDQKHIMRYQQFFASLAIRKKLDEGVTSGIVWHTQGSGKTALAYYLNRVLTDYFAEQGRVAKFYFIVDRLDLLEQASQEFEARGLIVRTANSRKELMEQFRTNQSLEGESGKPEITVVNIQRFAEDKTRVDLPKYATNLQRIFIVDEAHRGYNPKGSFLANLFDADPNSIKLAFTGTPLLKEERSSWKVFGEYLHTYYYDKSIQDGYTLKIIREDIETSYRERLSEIYDSIEHLVQKKDVKKSDIVEHDTYVKGLLRYIISDFRRFRIMNGDDTLGGMIVCETGPQARKLFAYFNEVQRELDPHAPHLRAELILHNEDDKETRKGFITEFKKNMTVDILIVFSMLLTGFDAPRLKRLYLGRKLSDHNLLQALTRVNRPYKDMHYGYIVDFADIKANFDQTNAAYLRELGRFSDPDEVGEGADVNAFVNIIEDPRVLVNMVREARQVLFSFDIENAEVFSAQISAIDDKQQLIEIRKALVTAKEAMNVARTFGDDELKEAISRIEVSKLPELLSEVERAIGILNQKEVFESADETRHYINEAMADIVFHFRVKSEEEMEMVAGKQEEFQQKWQRVIRGFTENIDQEDPEYVSLREAFVQRFKERGFVMETFADFDEESRVLDEIMDKLTKIKRGNDALARRYRGDAKFVRVHKRLREENARRAAASEAPMVAAYDEDIVDFLTEIKRTIDQKVYDRNDILKKDDYFERTVMTLITTGMKNVGFDIPRSDRLFIQDRISRQYLDQYHATYNIAA